MFGTSWLGGSFRAAVGRYLKRKAKKQVRRFKREKGWKR